MSAQPAAGAMYGLPGALGEDAHWPSADQPVIVIMDEFQDPAPGAARTEPAAEIREYLGRLAAQARCTSMILHLLEHICHSPSLAAAFLIRLYAWPAGCHVEVTPAGRWVAWFTPRGCRYSSASLADVHAMAVKAAPAARRAR